MSDFSPPILLPEETLEPSISRLLLFVVAIMGCFAVGAVAMDWPPDGIILIALVGVVLFVIVSFTAAICFMLRVKIGCEGLRPAVPTLYQRVIRWDDVKAVRTSFVFVRGPFYLVQGRSLDEFCLLPRPYLLKNPESLRQIIERYAPRGSIVRKELFP